MERILLFEQFNNKTLFESLLETVSADVQEIQGEVKDVMDELGKEGATDDELKAALLMQALDNNGDVEKVDVEKLKKDVKEGMTIRGQALNEDAEGIIHIIEVLGNVLGNSALLEYILEKAEHLTGKKMDAGAVKHKLEQLVGLLRKITGLPAKALSKFLGWVGAKVGLDAAGKKALQLVGMAVVIGVFFAMGVAAFPVLGSGVLWWLMSLSGLIGKSIELVRIGKEIAHLISGGDKKEIEAEIEGTTPDELAKMAGAAV